ncbi:MAG: type II/IV secretion system ATPase subunit, partial [Candidatus Anstonellaceae archaeon]
MKSPDDKQAAGEVDSYRVSDGTLEAMVSISQREDDTIRTYSLRAPQWEKGTSAFVEDLKSELLKKVNITSQEALNLKMADELKNRFLDIGKSMVQESMPHLTAKQSELMARKIVQDMLGLGDLEFLLHDDWIEEICVNASDQPVWVYHRKYGWIKTDLYIQSENQIWNYATSIARGVGRQINTQMPLLDASLSTGDRVNATLAPISYFGNTITIRKFARKPWTITDYISRKTISAEVAALIWLAIQYELNVIISGGTGAGKTSMLNVLSMFIPQNQRVVSIEQTRELTLLKTYFQWVPLIVREPTAEGKAGITMLDLMVNALRMRPDRILVGEIRRAEEAQVLFEAMHTGHSVYATLHAETVGETVRRLANPPLNIPPVMMESLHLVLAMYRDRRRNVRRVLEVGELVPTDREGIAQNVIYRWRAYKDELVKAEPSVRLLNTIKSYT